MSFCSLKTRNGMRRDTLTPTNAHTHTYLGPANTHVYIYICPPRMDPGVVRLTYFFQCAMCFCFLDVVSKLGVPYAEMICMHAYICDTSNDISICNLKEKELECIQENWRNSELFCV